MHAMTPLWKLCVHTVMTYKMFIWFISVLIPTAYTFWVYEVASIQVINQISQLPNNIILKF